MRNSRNAYPKLEGLRAKFHLAYDTVSTACGRVYNGESRVLVCATRGAFAKAVENGRACAGCKRSFVKIAEVVS